MPEENAPLYSRGKYRLEPGKRSRFYQIVWYDESRQHYRTSSTGTAEIGAAEDALDRFYLKHERGLTICEACGRPLDKASGHLLTQAIADYLLARENRPSFGAIKPRLGHVLHFLEATSRNAIICDRVDGSFIEEFRRWSASIPVVEGKSNQKIRKRAPGTTEASIRMLAAVINFAHGRRETSFKASFTAKPPAAVSRTPNFRATVEQLAAMFRYCLEPSSPAGEAWSEKMVDRQRLHRQNLLRFLHVSVATWCRPDAAHDLSTKRDRDQWISNARVVQLNPRGRAQTKKHRPTLPVPHQFGRLLDYTDGFYVTVKSVRKAFEAMLDELALPRDRETGLKLIRRSVATIVRRRIGEERWVQGEIMLGHRKASTSDLYALFDPANLGVALGATTDIINEIENLVPGSFSPISAGLLPHMTLVGRAPRKGKI